MKSETVIKLVGCVLLLGCIALVLVMHWVEFSLSNQLRGVAFSIFGYAPDHPGVMLFSFGIVAAVLLWIALMGTTFDEPTVMALAGAALLLTALWAWLEVAVLDPVLLVTLARETDWARTSDFFGIRFLPPNFGHEPNFWNLMSFDTLQDRLLDGWYFMGTGWYVVLAAGVALIVAAGRFPRGWRTRRTVALTVAAGVLITAACMVRPVLGQHVLTRAIRADSEGQGMQALADYRRAIHLDGWNARNLRIYQRMGAIDAGRGQTATGPYEVYRAETIVADNLAPATVGDLPTAVGIYERLARGHGRLAELARMRGADVLTVLGLHLFYLGAFGEGVRAWRAALHLDPYMWLAAGYLSRGDYAVGQYQQAATIAGQSVAALGDPIFLSDIYSNLGDSQFQQNQYGDAHVNYYNSYYVAYSFNRRGVASLTGP